MLAFLYKIKGKNKKKPTIPETLNNKKILIIKFLGFGSIILKKGNTDIKAGFQRYGYWGC